MTPCSCGNFGYLVTYSLRQIKQPPHYNTCMDIGRSTYGHKLMRINNSMKLPQVRKATVRIAVIDSDPLRFVGFRVLLSAEPDLELHSVALAEIGINQEVDIVLLGSHPGKSLI